MFEGRSCFARPYLFTVPLQSGGRKLWLFEAAVGTGADWLEDFDPTAPSLKSKGSSVKPSFSLSLGKLENACSEAFYRFPA